MSEFYSFKPRYEAMNSGNVHKKAVRFLYKTILKLHRGLPDESQALGTAYVKDEFRRHKSCDPHTAVVFMTEWSVILFNSLNFFL